MMTLAMSELEVARLTRPQRQERVQLLMIESERLLESAIETHIISQNHTVAGICILYSGGNDSTVLAHLMRKRATHAVHANTTIGIEATRQFVRDTTAMWGLPLLEVFPGPGNTYRELVLEQGFPGPGHHFKMFQRLKERGLRDARRQLVKNPRKERVVFVAGRRRTESGRRTNVPEAERVDSTVWSSPMVDWTKADLNQYRIDHPDCPTNDTTKLIHMSGECLCGSFAKQHELTEIAFWFPEVAAEIRALEDMIKDDPTIPEYRKKWGWGGDPEVLALSRFKRKSQVGRLCTSCDARATGGEIVSVTK
jgi:3'-phosphoadenosine 5'-phosphosulfate sulfotransferase (PAPS reductase)/FAD synthetase